MQISISFRYTQIHIIIHRTLTYIIHLRGQFNPLYYHCNHVMPIIINRLSDSKRKGINYIGLNELPVFQSEVVLNIIDL